MDFATTNREQIIGLHGKDFAMLTESDLKCFRLLRDQGRKFGLIVSVEVMHDSENIQAELAAVSPAQQEEIYRRLRTQVQVRWFATDNESSTEAM